jgi:hypothetical protein
MVRRRKPSKQADRDGASRRLRANGIWGGTAVSALTATLALTSGCGRVTDVKPPQLVAPEAIEKLAAENERKGIRLSWERPNEYVDGSAMHDLAAFRIERSFGDGPFLPLKKVEVTDRDRFRQIRRFRLMDEGVEPDQHYRYRVVSFTLDGHVSAPSNVAEIERVVPTPANAEPKEP